jgi:hypothetical protein
MYLFFSGQFGNKYDNEERYKGEKDIIVFAE